MNYFDKSFHEGGRMYYQRVDVRRAIMDFAKPNGSSIVRECALYNARARRIQRYIDGGSQTPIYLDTPESFESALAAGATAFYCSYWRHSWAGEPGPLGRDLVWTTRAKQGGVGFAKETTAWVLRALKDVGISEPWVKYSGELGFDLVIPVETIPCEALVEGFTAQDLQRDITNYIVSYLREHFQEALIDDATSPIAIKRGNETCLLSELRVRRGLLLAPMSLNPQTGLVSVTLDPRRVAGFSVFDASPADARGFEWRYPPKVAHELVSRARVWQSAPAERVVAY